MDELGVALSSITGLRVLPYWPENISPPTAIVGLPDSCEFDKGFSRGSDRATFPVTVVVGRVDVRTARNNLSDYASGSGSSSVKAAVEDHAPIAYHSARVTKVEFGAIQIGGVEYVAATFDIDISAPGEG
jgi:hypothetical protein